MGNVTTYFQWQNNKRFCKGTMKIINDDLILTCTDKHLEWLQDLTKICFQYDNKSVCIIDDIGSIATIETNKIILKIEKKYTEKYSAGHICAIYLWTNKCEAIIKLKECIGLENNTNNNIKF